MSAGAPTAGEPFVFRDDPDAPGWHIGSPRATGMFIDIFGVIRLRVEGPATVRIRFMPEPRHRNVMGGVHGGYVMAVVDQVLFLAPMMLGVQRVRGGLTIDSSTQFFAPLRSDTPFDAVVEQLRETGRMLFLRGLIEQAGTPAVAFSGTVRKASAPR